MLAARRCCPRVRSGLASSKLIHTSRICAQVNGLPRDASDARMSALEQHFAAFVSADPQPQIILGTQSESRRAVVDELAAKYDFKYSVITADIDEQAIRRKDPQELVLVLAHAKADAILKKLKDAGSCLKPGYLVTCDQVVVYKGAIREKPRDADEARAFIRSYADAPASTVGACVCVCLDTGVHYEDVDMNEAHIDALSEETIDQLIAEGLMIEHPLVQGNVRRITGTLDGIMGLSREAFMRVLLQTVQESTSISAPDAE